MDYKSIASALAKLGMNGDTELIHVNKTELAQIQTHLGRSPHINPHTGLMAFDDGGDSGDSGDPGGDSNDSAGSASGAGAGNAGGGAGDPGSDNADTGTAGDPNSGDGNNTSSTAAMDAFNATLQDVNMDDYNIDMAHYTDFTENFSMPNTDVFSQALNAITGIQLGHNMQDDLMAQIDVNPFSVLSFIDPVVGLLGKTATDLMGISHVTATVGPNGVSFNTASPMASNSTNLANGITNVANDLGFQTGVDHGVVSGSNPSSSTSNNTASTSGVSTGSNNSTSNSAQSVAGVGSDNVGGVATPSPVDFTNNGMFGTAAPGGTKIASSTSTGSSNTSSDLGSFIFDKFGIDLTGDMTKAQRAENQADSKKKKHNNLGTFIQNVANGTALESIKNPFSHQSAQINPPSLVSPSSFA